MTKGEFAKRISVIINKTRLRCRVKKDDKEFILSACKKTKQFKTIAEDETAWITIENVRAGPRYVRMLMLRRKEPGKRPSRQPCPKAKLVDAVYPPRKTKAKKAKNPVSSAKNHAKRVRVALRLHVADQIKRFRDCIVYPRLCPRTNKKLFNWMKIDIDHIDKSFLQLCDEFMEQEQIFYSDLLLSGPPNLKELQDERVSSAWQKYHAKHAKLAAVEASANRSAGSGDYEANLELLISPDPSSEVKLSGW